MNRPTTEREAPAPAGRELSPGERRLAESRAAIAEFLDEGDPDEFPRSRTMRFLTGAEGRWLALGFLAGLLVVKPKLARLLLRLLPLGGLLPVVRILQSLR